MKRDLKPFVVEVKRGTRRSSFLGHMDHASTMTEAQRRAEAVLFTPATEDSPPKASVSEASRRILPSLIEPAPPLPADRADVEPAPEERRPRPVGRPRKLKSPAQVEQHETTLAVVQPTVQPTFSEPALVGSSAAVLGDADEGVSMAPTTASAGGRTRLRDRSAILARYVLGTRPAPGERWTLTSRRVARRERSSAE